MGMKSLPIAELRRLLAAVSDHGKQHLVEVESDLNQTTFLLSEAIERLGASFMAIHQAVSEQQALLDTLLAEMPADQHAQLAGYRELIGQEVNAVVTGLQFQDLTSQLIARTVNRVNGLKDLLQELAGHGQDIEPDHEHAEIAKFLEEMNQNLNAGSHALAGGLRRSVNQQDMDSGEIELF